MAYKNYTHHQLQKIDAAHHIHPFTDTLQLNERGVRMITHADGPYIYDADDKQILDGMAGLWCVNVGYGRRELADAAHEQMLELPYYNTFFQTSVAPATLLAQKLSQLAPSHINHVFFGSSGSESNDTALKMARHYWALAGKPSKNIVISRRNAYHGSTIAGTSLGGMSAMHDQLYGAVPNIVHVMPPYAFGLAEDNETEAEFGLRAAQAIEEAVVEHGPDNVAAFIGEPVMGAGGVRVAPDSYWPEVQRICNKYDVLLILDEVITGYGRTGEWFACQRLGLEPDFINTAKALTSGYSPLSALLVSDRVADLIAEKGGEFFHGYTYSGHPVSCAVALANLAIHENEGLIERVRDETGPYLAQKLKETFVDHPHVGEVRSFGLMAGIELVQARPKVLFDEKLGAGFVVRDLSIEGGLLVRAVGDTIVLSPPLIWDRELIDLACERLHNAVDEGTRRLMSKS